MSPRETPSEPSYRELSLEDDGEAEPAQRPGPGAGLVTPLVLLGGLLLTFVLVRAGLRFFFLPIILPFGLGGGRLFRRLFGASHRRFRLQNGELSLLASSPMGVRREGVLDVKSGVFVTLVPSNSFVNGVREVNLRVVGRTGALAVTLSGSESARLFRRRFGTLLSEEDVPLLDEDEALQGAVAMRVMAPNASSAHDAGDAELPEIVELSWPSDSGGRSRTWLRFSADRWALRVRSGLFGSTSTGGPGPVTASPVALREADPFGGITVRHALELRAEGETVAVVGEGMSKPELLFIAGQLAHFASN